MQLIIKFNKEFRLLLRYIIDIYSKYAWAVPVKDEKGIKFTNAFRKVLTEFNRERNKIV